MDHTDIVRICADDFARFGDTFEGAGWTKTEEEADRRYAVMLDLMPASERPFTLLDFGCGAALDYRNLQHGWPGARLEHRPGGHRLGRTRG